MGRVFLHVGAPKTGTTYLQQVLWSNRKVLARRGALYWGRDAAEHFYAAQDLRGRNFRGHPDPRVPGAWERLARAAREWSGPTVLISHEVLATSAPEDVSRAADSLRPHEVHVVYTARDLGRQIPAMWQESVKNGRMLPYHDYLRTLQSPRPHMVGRIFWRTQDALDVLGRWGTAVPAERIHVVTVPPRGAEGDLLLRRFCAVTGLDSQGLDSSAATHGNVSLGLAEAELLRRVSQRLKGELSWPEHELLLKNFLTRRVLTGRPGSAHTGVPESEREWVLARSRALVDGLADRGYDVVGSLDELLPDFTAEPDTDPDPAADDVLDSAVDALAVLLSERRSTPRARAAARVRRLARRAQAHLPARP
jgi:hypothetical protein